MTKKTTQDFLEEYYLKYPDSEVDVIREYQGVHDHITCKCKTCGYIWETDPNSLLKGSRCPICSRKRQKLTHEIFINRLSKINSNIEILSKYNTTSDKVHCKCLVDNHEWWATPNKLLLGRGCPKCAGKISDPVLIEQRIKENNPDVILLEHFTKYSKKIKCQCLENPEHIWEASPSNLIHGTGCPHCRESKGEKAICHFLENNNINFKQEYWFDNCRDKWPLPFDFYLPDKNICIEYDGKQHFEIINFFGIGDEKAEDTFNKTQFHDAIKNNYCKDNNIELIRIPYTKYNTIEDFLTQRLIKGGDDGGSQCNI